MNFGGRALIFVLNKGVNNLPGRTETGRKTVIDRESRPAPFSPRTTRTSGRKGTLFKKGILRGKLAGENNSEASQKTPPARRTNLIVMTRDVHEGCFYATHEESDRNN